MTESPWNLHLGSLFWVVYQTTTTGYNTFKPTNFDLMRVLISGMAIGKSQFTNYHNFWASSSRAFLKHCPWNLRNFGY